MVGESYGTTRAAGLAEHLLDRGIAFNGVLLVSSILNFQTARFTTGNDLPYVLYLPTYAATAWYDKRLAARPAAGSRGHAPRSRGLGRRARTPPRSRRARRLPPDERSAVAERLARYTGLDRRVVEQNDLRIEIGRFCKDLLRDRGQTVGRLDSRFVGTDRNNAAERPAFDPSLAAIGRRTRPCSTTTSAATSGSSPTCRTTSSAEALGRGSGARENQFADTSDALGGALTQNPHMRLFVGSGYFDSATPYFATDTRSIIWASIPGLQKRVTRHYYRAGQMMYIDVQELTALRRDVAAFIASAIGDGVTGSITGPPGTEVPAPHRDWVPGSTSDAECGAGRLNSASRSGTSM